MLEEYADKILKAIEGGLDLLADEMPAFIGELLTFYRTWHTVEAVALLTVIVLFWAVAFPRAWRENNKSAYGSEGAVLVMILGGVASLGMFFYLAFGVVPALLKAWIAPRLFIIEWLRGVA